MRESFSGRWRRGEIASTRRAGGIVGKMSARRKRRYIVRVVDAELPKGWKYLSLMEKDIAIKNLKLQGLATHHIRQELMRRYNGFPFSSVNPLAQTAGGIEAQNASPSK